MVWLFLSVVLLVAVYLAVQFPAFRKAVGVCLALLVIVVAAGAGWLYYENLEDQKRRELSRRLTSPNEISITDAVLGQTYGSWKVKGNVTNHSSHELSGLTLKIKVQDCPISSGRCTTIGENDVSTYLSVPPNQMRAFEQYVSLHDMPTLTKWQWSYDIREVRAKLK